MLRNQKAINRSNRRKKIYTNWLNEIYESF